MEHKGTVRIETERLILRRITVEDAEAAFRNWVTDREVTKYLTWPAHENVEQTREIFQRWVKGYERMDYYHWCITLKENGDEPIGTIAAVKQDEQINMVHIGYCIGRKWWRRGITSEALGGIIPFFFDEVKVNRIESRHDPLNPNSGKVMMKCGLKYEGTLRDGDYSNRGISDTCMYGLLARDYYADK